MSKRLAALVALSAALAATLPLAAQAPMTAPGSNNPALAAAGSYKVDPYHTQVVWTVNHLGFTPYTGIFGDVSGSLTFDPKSPAAAKVDVTIPVSKVTTASAGLTAHLLKPAPAGGKADFFGAAPADAHFVSTKVEPGSDGTAKITGDLTLNGVTRPVVLDAKFYGAGKLPAQMGGGDGLGFTAHATLKRSEFGVAYGIPMVSDEVELTIAAGFIKAA